MTIPIDQVLKQSFVISINENRYQTFCNRFNAYDLNTPLPKLFKGFTIPNGIYKECGFFKTNNLCNCFFSHIAIVKMAQSLDWPFVCIFEDDAYPCINCRNKFQLVLNKLPNDIDLLKIGHLGNLKDKQAIDSMFEVLCTYGSHAYIVFKQYYQQYVDLSNKDLHIDRLSMNNKNRLILATKDILFMQNDTSMDDTLHNNDKYFKLLKDQGYLKAFNL